MEERIWHKQYEAGISPTIEFEDVTLVDMLQRARVQYADRPALSFLNVTLNYREFGEEVDRLATALHGMGVGPGSKVAIQLPNLPQTVIGYFAVLRLGAQTVMTNPLYTPREIVHQWNDSEATVAIVLDSLYDQKIRQVREELAVEHYVVAAIPEYLRFPLNLLAPLKLKRMNPPMMARVSDPGTFPFRTLVRGTPAAVPEIAVTMDDVATLQYTGGTTGVSKGAMLTHRNLSYNVQQIDAWNTGRVAGGEVVFGCLPFFHIYGQTVAMNMAAFIGGHLIVTPNPRDIPVIVKTIIKRRVTIFPAVPAMYNAVNQFPGVDKMDLSCVKICNSGSAPLPADTLVRFEALTGAKITEGFGLTETSPVTHSNPVFATRKIGSIGVPVPETDARIVDLDDSTVDMPVGKEGELLVKGPQIMKGYWKRDDATAEMIVDGWLHTGDIAVMDEDGFFFIVGRKKDMILASGYNVYPDEVDRVLAEHEAVLESATIGIPDEKRGETVKSFVVLVEGKKATAEELVAHCRESLASYKVPRMVEFRDSLPKSTVLKILRRELRDEELKKKK